MNDLIFSWPPTAWLDYFLIYEIPSVLVISYLLIDAWLNRPTEFMTGLMRILDKETSIKEKANEIAVILFALLFIIVAWPILIFWLLKQKRDEASFKAWRELPNFICKPEYLLAPETITKIEKANYFSDPLSSVPPLPFGHLYNGWTHFVNEMNDQKNEIWSFYVPKGGKVGRFNIATHYEISGYAKVRDGKIVSEFITESD